MDHECHLDLLRHLVLARVLRVAAAQRLGVAALHSVEPVVLPAEHALVPLQLLQLKTQQTQNIMDQQIVIRVDALWLCDTHQELGVL